MGYLLLQKCLKKVSLQNNKVSFTNNKRIIKFVLPNHAFGYQALHFLNL